MASSSSTSSFDGTKLPGGVPWAFIGAVAILLAVEVAVRLAPPARVIPYRGGLEEHFAIANYLHRVGAADVGFVGSSMTRAGIAAPQVREELEAVTGQSLYIANYGASGATADETSAIVHYMVRRNALPRLLMYEVSPPHFRPSTSFRLRKVAIFWGLHDWIGAWHLSPRQRMRVMPIVVRNEIGDRYLTFRYRDRFRYLAQELIGFSRALPAPMAGRLPQNWHQRASFAQASEERRERLVLRWLQGNSIDPEARLNEELVADMRRTLETARRLKIPMVLYEMPLTATARQTLPPHFFDDFYALMEDFSQRYGVPFIRIEDLGIELTDEDFADPSHLNRQGAMRLTQALTQRVIIPAMAGEGSLADGGVLRLTGRVLLASVDDDEQTNIGDDTDVQDRE